MVGNVTYLKWGEMSAEKVTPQKNEVLEKWGREVLTLKQHQQKEYLLGFLNISSGSERFG